MQAEIEHISQLSAISAISGSQAAGPGSEPRTQTAGHAGAPAMPGASRITIFAAAVAVAAVLPWPQQAWAQPAPAQEDPAPAEDPAPSLKAGADGFALKSADGTFQLKLRGYIQTDGRFFFADEDRPAVDTFLVRRARPIIEATLYDQVDLRLMPDFGDGRTVLQEAYLDIHPWPELRIRAGKIKSVFGLERLQSATSLLFIERAFPTSLVPNRDIGVQIHGDVLGGVLGYAVAALNGVPDGGSADVDTNNGKDFVARIFTHPFRKTDIKSLHGLGIGFAASYGDQSGTATAPNLPSFRTSGQQVFFSYLAGADDPVLADGTRSRISPQAYYYHGPFGIYGEYVSSSQEVSRGVDSATLKHQAWQVAASFVLFGAKAAYEGVKPAKPLNAQNGQWGAVEVGGRYSELRVDSDTFPLFASPDTSARLARNVAGAVNWYLNSNVRIAANFEHTTFEGGAADGGAGGGGDRPAEIVILNRFQVAW